MPPKKKSTIENQNNQLPITAFMNFSSSTKSEKKQPNIPKNNDEKFQQIKEQIEQKIQSGKKQEKQIKKTEKPREFDIINEEFEQMKTFEYDTNKDSTKKRKLVKTKDLQIKIENKENKAKNLNYVVEKKVRPKRNKSIDEDFVISSSSDSSSVDIQQHMQSDDEDFKNKNLQPNIKDALKNKRLEKKNTVNIEKQNFEQEKQKNELSMLQSRKQQNPMANLLYQPVNAQKNSNKMDIEQNEDPDFLIAKKLQEEENQRAKIKEYEYQDHKIAQDLQKSLKIEDYRKKSVDKVKEKNVEKSKPKKSVEKIPKDSNLERINPRKSVDKQIDIPKKDAKKLTPKKFDTGVISKALEVTYVLTGEQSELISRENLEKLIKSHGGKVTGSISGKTSYLITCGSEVKSGFGAMQGVMKSITESSKYKAAVAKNVKIMTDLEFDEFFFNKTNKRLSDFQTQDQGGAANLIEKFVQKEIESQLKIINPKALIPKKKDPPPSQQNQQTQQNIPQNVPKISNSLWTTLHQPSSIDECVGNSDNIKKIVNWLIDWEEVCIKQTKQNIVTTKWGSGQFPTKQDPNKKACLVSGPPGIGKTSAIRLIAKQMKYDLIEQNASDVRSKKVLQGFLGQLTDNKLISFGKDELNTKKRFIILMDEVDGCSAGDRGGIAQLIQIIKDSHTPIICVCNDRQHQKVRSLANHCYEFSKPTKGDIVTRMISVCKKEGLTVDKNTMDSLCEASGFDLRQILNSLQMLNNRPDKRVNYSEMSHDINKKDQQVMLSNFQAAVHLMSRNIFDKLSLHQKLDLFFVDHEFIPLIIQNQYLDSIPKVPQYDSCSLKSIAIASDSISLSDILSKSIRTHGNWSLLPQFAFLCSVYPCQLVCVNAIQPKFPQWMAKNSSQRKHYRLLREMRIYLAESISGSRFSLKFDYIPGIISVLVQNIKQNNIEACLDVMRQYNITPDIIKEHLVILGGWGGNDPFSDLSGGQKAAITRNYNNKYNDKLQKKKVKKIKETEVQDEDGMEIQNESEEDEQPDENNDSTSITNEQVKGQKKTKQKPKKEIIKKK